MKAVYIGYIAAIVWVFIPAVYLASAPDWYKTRVGRAFMYLTASTAGLFLLLLTGGLFGDYAGRELVRTLVYALVLAAGVRIIVLFIRLRSEGKLNLSKLERLGRGALK